MDLSKDKKINMYIQILLVLLVAIMIGLAKWFDFPLTGSGNTGVKILITVFMCAVYMIVHELTHGVFVKLLSGVKPTYLVKFPFLCTGSEAYFNKKSFIIVALSPIVLWGISLIFMLLLLPSDFFLSIYIVTILNFAGAAGDYFQVYAISRMHPMALIQDNGKETKVFLPI
jgi:hypothetical protein